MVPQVGHPQVAEPVEGQLLVAAGLTQPITVADDPGRPGVAAVERDRLEEPERSVGEGRRHHDVLRIGRVDGDRVLAFVAVARLMSMFRGIGAAPAADAPTTKSQATASTATGRPVKLVVRPRILNSSQCPRRGRSLVARRIIVAPDEVPEDATDP